MQAERVEVSWDPNKRNWLVRIEIGSEVIRRHCPYPQDVDETTLREAAAKTVVDEGYEADRSRIEVKR